MSFKPAFTVLCRRGTGPLGAPPNTLLYAGEPCALWFSSGRSQDMRAADPPIVAQAALQLTRWFDPPGWRGNPAYWDPAYADYLQFTNMGLSSFPKYSVVYSGIMWYGTPDAHCRFDLTPFRSPTAALPVPLADGPQSAFGLPLLGGRTATFDVYRPFGAAVAVSVANPGTIYPDLYGGRGGYFGGSYYTWTDILDCDDSVDIRDGMSRAAGLDVQSYSDGDEVRFPTGIAVTRYVVVRVTRVGTSVGGVKKRVYLARDSAHWPGP